MWPAYIKHVFLFALFNVIQRFFVNEAYWRDPDGPVFLFIGGEGPLFEYDVLAGSVKMQLVSLHVRTYTFADQTHMRSYSTLVCKDMFCLFFPLYFVLSATTIPQGSLNKTYKTM